MQVLDESSEPNAVVTIEDNKAAENIEIYLVCIFSIMQSQDSFAGKKHWSERCACSAFGRCRQNIVATINSGLSVCPRGPTISQTQMG